MTTLREAAQQALEALEWFNKYGSEEHGPSLRGAECSLRAALAEPTVPSDGTDSHQPVAWYHVPYPGNGISPVVSMYQQREPSLYGVVVPLYTAPPQRKPLTEEEIGKVAAPYYGTMGFRVEAFARAIERAYGIGEKE